VPALRDLNPLARPENIVTGPNYRITVLTDGLARLEYSESGSFEDRPSQAVLDRGFEPSDFEVVESDGQLEIRTTRFHLVYDKQPFRTEGLSVQARHGVEGWGRLWRYGIDVTNLGGTARTLDNIDGACPLEPGVLSRTGVAVVDDSRTVLLTDDGWIAPREPGRRDLYVFAYGADHRAAIRAFYRLTGAQPLLPRFALGNWWSRYHPYSAGEYLDLMDRFAADAVPLSVAVLDMDWHQVDIDLKYGTGWTGYSWNTELFPDPPAFLADLHERRLAVSLNVHPAEGVHAHEDRYPAIAERLGIDPPTEQPVNFDPTSREFLQAYFEELHHPLEDDGVDFWWLDWQQGGVTRMPGLDPLWLLNHFHYLDSARHGRRPLTFSRYAGVGSHRYPVGFSGDTVISWASLDFQPYFTATASNIGYGWWSHDIGGHFFGAKDDELATRWVQLGTFSPILRLHSSLSAFNSKEPWRFGERAERVMKEALRLRHQLVPYLYTMNRRAHEDGAPLVAPVYWDHADRPEAYAHRNEYLFGTNLLLAPITAPADRATGLGATTAWLPPGDWIDVLTGFAYRGDRTTVLHRGLDSIPVLARAGSMVPLVAPDALAFGTANPDALQLRVYAGGDASFILSEDRDDERWAETEFAYQEGRFSIAPVRGELASVPSSRTYELVLCGFADVVSVTVDGRELDLAPGPVPGSVAVSLGTVAAAEGLTVHLAGELQPGGNRDVRDRIFAVLDDAQIEYAVKEGVRAATARPLETAIAELTAMELPGNLYPALVELLTSWPATS
jgi:alpha-glucosidase (family GH31 glycosyl hydrolase)